MIQVGIAIEIACIADFNSFHFSTTMSLDHVTKKVSTGVSTETHKGTFSTSLAFDIGREMNHMFQRAFLFLEIIWDVHRDFFVKCRITKAIGGPTLDCVIWFLVDTNSSATFGFGFNHIRV